MEAKVTYTETVLARARSMPEGTVLTAAALAANQGSMAARRALSRLAASGSLLRAARGAYVAPVSSRFGTHAPSPAKVAEQMAASGKCVLPSGAAEANRLGLSTQVPMREVFFTSGKSQNLKLGARTLQIKHAPGWQTAHPHSEAGAAVRAMAWLGPSEAKRVAAELHARLPAVEWTALMGRQAELPAWMASSIQAEAAGL